MQDLSGIHIVLDELGKAPKYLNGLIPGTVFQELDQAATIPEAVTVALTLLLKSPGRIKGQGARLHVQGTIQGMIHLDCALCLESFPWPLEINVDQMFISGPDPDLQSGEKEITDDTIYLIDGIFSVRRLVAEELVLALPMMPVCNPDCLGLCPDCGENRNQGLCQCPMPVAENPFAILKPLILHDSH